MADFTYRVSGNVSFSDGSSSPFEASVQNGLVHDPFSADSLESFRQAYASATANVSADIDALLALFVGPTHSLNPTAPAASKSVSDFTMEVSGMVANNDGTVDAFAAQFSFSNGYLVADVNNGYDAIINNGSWNALVTDAWEVLTGNGNATLST
jgi:hypothetical protein